jgi:CDP-diacylglycerol---glycerol-3-phosphate 3-phosphatidyltransferase
MALPSSGGTISYTSARGENTIPQCKVGFLERPERIVLLIIGALADRMAPSSESSPS